MQSQSSRTLSTALAATLALVLGLGVAAPSDAQFWKRNKDAGEKGEKKDEDRRCEDMGLAWNPSEEWEDLDPVNLTGISDLAIEVGTFEDARRIEDPREIGRNIEDADDDDPEDRKILYATTDDDIPGFVADHVELILGELGYRVVGPGEGQVLITGRIHDFHVEEDGTYDGDVRLFLRAEKSDGTVLYEGMHGEDETTWGRSYKCENYTEVLSDALMETVHDMAEEDDFHEALQKVGG